MTLYWFIKVANNQAKYIIDLLFIVANIHGSLYYYIYLIYSCKELWSNKLLNYLNKLYVQCKYGWFNIMNYESSIYPEIIEDFITDFELGVAC